MNTLKKSALIIGGGPAGCQCALWLHMLGLKPIIVEQSDKLGGLQALVPYKNNWIVGLVNTTGRELAQQIQQHIEQLEIPVLFNSTISKISDIDNGYSVSVGQNRVEVSYIVLATGVKQLPQQSDKNSELHYDVANKGFSRVEWEANIPEAFTAIKNKLLDERGFVITDKQCLTPVPNIYAVGELTDRMHPCVVTSMADGVVAAKAIQEELEL